MVKYWFELFPLVVATLKKGAKNKGEVVSEVKWGENVGRCKTTERILDALEEAKLIKKEEDRRYTWIKDYQEFETKEIYEIKLNHSKKLVKGVKSQKESREFDFDIGAWMEDDNFKFFIQHLRYGYPDIYKYWRKIEKSQTDMVKNFSEFYEKVKAIASEKGVEIRELPGCFKTRQESGFRYIKKAADLKERIHLIPPEIIQPLKTFLNNLIVHKASEDDIEEVIENCISSKEIETLYDNFLYPREYHAVDLDKFLLELQPIIIGVLEDGEPLRGSCDRCPKSTIGREKNKKEGAKK